MRARRWQLHAGFMIETGDRDIGVRPKQASQRAAPMFGRAKQLDQAFSLFRVVAAARRLDANLTGKENVLIAAAGLLLTT